MPSQLFFASNSPGVLEAVRPALLAPGARVTVVFSPHDLLTAMRGPTQFSGALLDVDLPGMSMGQLLGAIQPDEPRRCPIVLISDITQEWTARLEDGVIDDLIPLSVPSAYWRFRLDAAVRTFRCTRELDRLREASAIDSQTDRLTGICNRASLLSLLFRETDRVQRTNTSLSMILFDIDDFGHWNSNLGTTACDDLLVAVVGRVQRMLRSYDMFDRVGKDEFLLGLPGCSGVNAVMLAERIRVEVFAEPFHVASRAVRLTACFGISASQARSPVVVLREAERALQLAKGKGPDSIQSSADSARAQAPPAAFLSRSNGDDLLTW